MQKPVDDGKTTVKQTYKAAARMGHKGSIAALKAPEFPRSVGYLWRMIQAMHGRSGMTEFGLAPLAPATIESVCRLMDWWVRPHEVDALMELDSVLLYPDGDEVRPMTANKTRRRNG